jgi:hypothetical protein
MASSKGVQTEQFRQGIMPAPFNPANRDVISGSA